MTRRFIETGGVWSRHRMPQAPDAVTVSDSTLPAGAATEAKQDVADASLSTISSTVAAVDAAIGATTDDKWDGAADSATMIAIEKRQVSALDDLRNGGGFMPTEDPIFFLGAS